MTVSECAPEPNPRRWVCSNQNETYESDCQLYKAKISAARNYVLFHLSYAFMWQLFYLLVIFSKLLIISILFNFVVPLLKVVAIFSTNALPENIYINFCTTKIVSWLRQRDAKRNDKLYCQLKKIKAYCF